MTRKFPIFLLLLLTACQHTTYVPTQRVASDFNRCYIQCHGAYYDSIAANVLSLDLYSAGLDLDSTGYMQGTGTNLYLSDVFVPLTDTVLLPGVYTADTTGSVMTFLPGKDFEGNPTGTYILQVTDNKVGSITLCTDSTMTVAYDRDTLDIRFRLRKTDGRIYTAQYRGIPNWK